MNVFERTGRAVVAAFLGVGVLLSGAGSAPLAAYALPGEPVEECGPQPVTAADAELLGSLRLLEAAAVGYETRISMQAPSVRIPDPKCDGQYITVPLAFRWDVLSRPAVSSATLSATTTTTARLTPDVAGDWQVAFTACPFGCRVRGTTLTIQPLRRTISFTSSIGIEGRLDSEFFGGTLQLSLFDSRIQVSHTDEGGFVSGTPYEVTSYPMTTKYQIMCVDVLEPPAECEDLLESIINRATLHTITPSFSSFIDFGPTLEKQGAPSYILLPIEPYEHEIPTWKRGAFIAAQGALLGGIAYSVDIDRVRLLANDIHVDFGDFTKWRASIEGGTLNLRMAFDSAHPTIKCEGHFTHRAGFVVYVNSGWADEACPDYDLNQMGMTIHLYPGVQNDTITVASATVDVELTPKGVQSDLIDYFLDVSTKQEVKIADKVRARLLEPENREKLGAVLLKVLQHKFPDLVRVRSSQIVGSDWVVRYERD